MKCIRVRVATVRSVIQTAQRILLMLGMSVFVFAVMLGMTVGVQAQGPVESAKQTLDHATVEAQQTRTAQDNELANQRLTSTALENVQRRQAATWTAQAQMRDVDATQAARAATANYVQTQVSANATTYARATADASATLSVDKTRIAVASSTSVAKTRIAEDELNNQATRTTSQTQTREAEWAKAARTAEQLALEAATRDAAIRSLVLGLGGMIALLTLTIIAFLLIRTLWRVSSVKPTTIVEIVEESAPAQTPSMEETRTDHPPVVEKIEPDDMSDVPNFGEPIFVSGANDRPSVPLLPSEPPPSRVIIDDEIAAQAKEFNDRLKESE